MILIEDVKAPVLPAPSPSALEAQRPPSTSRPSSSTDPLLGRLYGQSRTSYLSGSTRHSASVRSLSPPPEYTPPPPPLGIESSTLTKTGRLARARLLRALLAAVAIYLTAALVIGLVLDDSGGQSDFPEEESAPSLPSPIPGPIARPNPDPPRPPHVPKQPSNRCASPGQARALRAHPSTDRFVLDPPRSWNSSYYLPPLEHGHVVGCAPVTPSATVVYNLALPTPTLALRIGAVRPRRLGRPVKETDDDVPTEPEIDVRVLPWLEDDDSAQWGPWSEGEVKVVVKTSVEALGVPIQVCQLSDTLQAGVGIYVRACDSGVAATGTTYGSR